VTSGGGELPLSSAHQQDSWLATNAAAHANVAFQLMATSFVDQEPISSM
jgi:hypothetical protein